MMQLFSGWQYLLIDAANAFGMDKETFDWRISFIEGSLEHLEDMVADADSKPLFMKAVMAIRKAQAQIPTGHVMGMDACCSGIQVMSALTGCIEGARNTGLVDPNVRADAYGKLKEVMEDELGGEVKVSRSDAKQALMTSFYGSKAKPIEIFGEDTPELSAFYQAAHKLAPGAWELLQDLLGSWRPFATEHCWKLPDGFDVKVKVMVKKEARIEVDELDHATFTYEFYENQGKENGLSNVANVVHSVDAYVLRNMHRRCNYDAAVVEKAVQAIINEITIRNHAHGINTDIAIKERVQYYIDQYDRSGMADPVIFPYLDCQQTLFLSDEHLKALYKIAVSMLVHKPFQIITIHDEFKCGPNNMNFLRQHYIDIFAELADSNVLSDILSQIHGVPGTFDKLSDNLSSLIRGSNYALS